MALNSEVGACRKSRILVPVDSFYERQEVGPNLGQPYLSNRTDGRPIVVASLREWWRDAEGVDVNTATIISGRPPGPTEFSKRVFPVYRIRIDFRRAR